MQTTRPSSLQLFPDTSLPGAGPLAVLLYDTVESGKRGMSVLSSMFDGESDERRTQLWRLDFLHDPATAESAACDVLEADVILMATSGRAPLTSEFKCWFTAMLNRKKGEEVAVVTLLGSEATCEASGDLHFVAQRSREAGLDFFAPFFVRPADPELSGGESFA